MISSSAMDCQDRQIKAKEGSRSSTRKSLVFFDMEASMHRGPHSGARLQCDHGRAPRAASHRPVHVWFGRQGQRASTSEATGLLLSSKKMKELLQLRCDGTHWHQQLEGASRTRHAQEWPEQLCLAMIWSAVEEMKSQVIM